MANTNGATDTPGNEAPNDDRYESLNEFILVTDTALTNAMLPDVLPLLVKRGYTAAIINVKLADLEALRELTRQQIKEYGDQYKASNNYKEKLAALSPDYAAHVELARIDFEDDAAALTTLGLTGRRKRTQADFAAQALQLYKGALANTDYAAVMATNGVDAAELTAMRDGFTELQALINVQTAETGEAQTATQKRDAAWDALEDWMEKFYRKAKVALKDHPQLREKLGMLER